MAHSRQPQAQGEVRLSQCVSSLCPSSVQAVGIGNGINHYSTLVLEKEKAESCWLLVTPPLKNL